MTARASARWMLLLFVGMVSPGFGRDNLTNSPSDSPSNVQPASAIAESAPLVVRKESSPGTNGASADGEDRALAAKRERLRVILGAVDARVIVPAVETLPSAPGATNWAETDSFSVQAVRWPVFGAIWGQGLWLKPKAKPVARVVVIPDADQSPEMLAGLASGLDSERQLARRLVENDCEVLIPVLIDRQSAEAGTNQAAADLSHRDWLCRQALGMGRHIIGYEIEKVLALVDYFHRNSVEASPSNTRFAGRPAPIAVAGYGEGGLLAFYSAALDKRIAVALVSGYFDSPRAAWNGPLSREVFGLLPGFRDSEVLSLIAPRRAVIEHSAPPVTPGQGARLGPVDFETVETEFNRALAPLKLENTPELAPFVLVSGPEGLFTGPGSDRALAAFLNAVGVPGEQAREPIKAPLDWRMPVDAEARQREQIKQIERFTQDLFKACEAGARK